MSKTWEELLSEVDQDKEDALERKKQRELDRKNERRMYYILRNPGTWKFYDGDIEELKKQYIGGGTTYILKNKHGEYELYEPDHDALHWTWSWPKNPKPIAVVGTGDRDKYLKINDEESKQWAASRKRRDSFENLNDWDIRMPMPKGELYAFMINPGLDINKGSEKKIRDMTDRGYYVDRRDSFIEEVKLSECPNPRTSPVSPKYDVYARKCEGTLYIRFQKKDSKKGRRNHE